MSEKDQEFQIIKLAYEFQLDALKDHVTRANSIFTWSTTLMLALIGYIIYQQTTIDDKDRLLLATGVLIVFIMAYLWQRDNQLKSLDHAASLNRITRLLHLTEPGYFGSPEPVIIISSHTYREKPTLNVKLGVSPYNLVLMSETIILLLVIYLS